jgi:hypothetical protein
MKVVNTIIRAARFHLFCFNKYRLPTYPITVNGSIGTILRIIIDSNIAAMYTIIDKITCCATNREATAKPIRKEGCNLKAILFSILITGHFNK